MQGERRAEAAARVESAMHIVWVLGLPMSAGLFLLARPLTVVLYGQSGATSALEVLALGSSVLAMQQVLGGALQASGRGWLAVKNLGMGTAAKFAMTWEMTPILGIRGAALATVLASVLVAYLNWRDWARVVAVPTSPWRFLRWPLVGSVVMAMGVLTWQARIPHMSLMVHTGLAVLLGALVYAAVVWISGEKNALLRAWRNR
jgi:stage V sporulation protein B